MTAEVAILNRSGVALAADSAVTVSYPGGQKVYNSVNKLFTLSKYAPIGVMVYGVAELTSVPWETIIKAFRTDLGDQRFEHVRDYADCLFRYINDHQLMFAEDQQRHQVAHSALLQFRDILGEIDATAKEEIAKRGDVTEQRFKRIAATVINRKHAEWLGFDRLPGAPADLPGRVRRKWTKTINEVIDLVFGTTPLTVKSRAMLVEIASIALVTAKFPDSVSGVVVAGFGDAEYFPRLYAFDVEGVVLNFMKMRESEDRAVEIGPFNRASIVPFAQREMVTQFMEGIDPAFRRLVGSKLGELSRRLSEEIVVASGTTGKAADDLRKKSRAAARPLVEELSEDLHDYLTTQHIKPIVTAVQALPKEEIAAMAEALVSLTSFKRRVTQDPETVGGPVDVAVISKGDGFIWIKRKHYFEPALNHQFFANYYDGGVVLDD